jgi:hydrogenase expression/formation protein HypC
MCWAVPAKIDRIDGSVGAVELDGTIRQVGLQLIDDPRVGDYVLVHAGFAIQKLNEEEAAETIRVLNEVAAELRRQGMAPGRDG